MSDEDRERTRRIVFALGRLIEICRAAESAPESLAAQDKYRWNQQILDSFEGLLEEREDLVLLKAMLRRLARAEMAAELLPSLEGLMGVEFYDFVSERLADCSNGGPVLVFDKTQVGAGSPPRLDKKPSASARGKGKGNRGARRRPAGDAA